MVILNGIYTYNFRSECIINYGEVGIAMVWEHCKLLHKKLLGQSVKQCQLRKENLSVWWDNFSDWEQHSFLASVEILKHSYLHTSALLVVRGEPCISVPAKWGYRNKCCTSYHQHMETDCRQMWCSNIIPWHCASSCVPYLQISAAHHITSTWRWTADRCAAATSFPGIVHPAVFHIYKSLSLTQLKVYKPNPSKLN